LCDNFGCGFQQTIFSILLILYTYNTLILERLIP